LGGLLAGMLGTLCDRGPDSAGFAVYGATQKGRVKLTLRVPADADVAAVEQALSDATGGKASVTVRNSHLLVALPEDSEQAVRKLLARLFAEVAVVSFGRRIEMYKDMGWPGRVAERFGLAPKSGTHAIDHTRIATESPLTTGGGITLTTFPDQCLVHNG